MTVYHLGVDLGTSYSAAALAEEGDIALLERDGASRIPSTVFLSRDDDVLLAGTAAEHSIGQAPDRAERNPKRAVTRGDMLLGGRWIPAERALAALLGLFLAEARRRHDGQDPALLVLTHPVSWTAEHTRVLRAAAERVAPGVRVELLGEPVAAAECYARDRRVPRGGSVAVYDLGGGTFDTAVVTVGDNGFEVAGAPGGDPEIGGESFDQYVLEHFGAQLAAAAPEWWADRSSGTDRRSLTAQLALREQARHAREALSSATSVGEYVADADVDVHVTRSKLESMISTDLRATADLLEATIRSSGRTVADLDGIYVTGGASRTPMVADLLRARFADTEVRFWKDPKTVVALGAAAWGARCAAGTLEADAVATKHVIPTPPAVRDDELRTRETARVGGPSSATGGPASTTGGSSRATGAPPPPVGPATPPFPAPPPPSEPPRAARGPLLILALIAVLLLGGGGLAWGLAGSSDPVPGPVPASRPYVPPAPGPYVPPASKPYVPPSNGGSGSSAGSSWGSSAVPSSSPSAYAVFFMTGNGDCRPYTSERQNVRDALRCTRSDGTTWYFYRYATSSADFARSSSRAFTTFSQDSTSSCKDEYHATFDDRGVPTNVVLFVYRSTSYAVQVSGPARSNSMSGLASKTWYKDTRLFASLGPGC